MGNRTLSHCTEFISVISMSFAPYAVKENSITFPQPPTIPLYILIKSRPYTLYIIEIGIKVFSVILNSLSYRLSLLTVLSLYQAFVTGKGKKR